MVLRVYNTMTRGKEEFRPREGKKVGIYVCGVTPYNYCHVGNARPYVVWDVFRRYLEYKGYEVFHVQNFTDVDDKILARAAQEGKTPGEIAEKYIAEYYADMDALGVKRAHFYPRVTEHIPDIIAMVQGLVEKGYAYEVDGDVYYDVGRFAGYGKLSGRSLEEMRAGARVEVDEKKANPMDFALWKRAKPGEISWDSPWGKGRPGWHIECSVMSHKYLGEGFDFHGGGVDLIFPHHENEIAQTEAYTGQPFVRYWLHNGFVNFSGEKMAKSVGNVITIREARQEYSGMAVRLYLLSTHYRSPIDFDLEKLAAAQKGWERLQNAREGMEQVLGRGDDLPPQPPEGELKERARNLRDRAGEAVTKFVEAMDDDFNTALAIGILFDLTREINSFLRQPVATPGEKAALARAREVFQTIGGVLGLLPAPEKAAAEGLVNELLQLIIDVRQEARSRKDFALADSIRERLGQLGIILEDTPQGIRYRRK
ncbi:MAG TPA: cysteine--tRNA ligase [Firmicutes bacterium]|nr:cysteine--tRNA ligase [Bacillota bacterium]